MSNFLSTNQETLKDLDYMLLNQTYPGIFHLDLLSMDRDSILESIENDCRFLRANNLMDYSLLIGIELNLTKYRGDKNKIPNSSRFNSVVSDSEPEQKEELVIRKYMSKCGKFIYHIGIIDYLQPFRIMRKLEIYYKTKILKAKANEISSINPESYASRFELFMRNNVFYNPNYKFLEFIIDAKTKNAIQMSNRFYSIGDKNDLPNILDEDQPSVEDEDFYFDKDQLDKVYDHDSLLTSRKGTYRESPHSSVRSQSMAFN